MLKILKASAGSGKTYNLAKEYIRLVTESDLPDAYRHVLAVTFTNKATEEMKRRILKELHALSSAPEDPALQKRAKRQLSLILHDYSAFSVSTIDRFFQQALRAFSREIGQFASYQVQIDRDALLQESVDRVLDGLGEGDAALLEWLTAEARENLEQKGKISLDDDLLKMAKGLSDIKEGNISYDKKSMDALRERCDAIIKDFEKAVADAAVKVLEALDSVGISPEDFAGKGGIGAIRKNLESADKPTEPFMRKLADPDKWFAKANAGLLPAAKSAAEGPISSYLGLFGEPYREYVTAGILKNQLYALGVAGELKEALEALQKEKNVLSLDDSASILKDIIGGTETPFIYEKMGVRYEHFLLDEFQDTSKIQWDNFKPLVHSGIDSGKDSLVVGDVKQSIYRWRGSDWDLLNSGLEKEFRSPDVTPLKENWRTCREIVNFNNDFFVFAAKSMDAIMGDDTISKIYADVSQTPRFSQDAPGSMEAVFTRDQMEEILNTVDEVKGRGASYSDIAILVRGNDDGARIATALVSKGHPVVSDDSLYVKSSVTVRRLVSQLSLADSVPADGSPDVAGYMARSMNVEIPENYHSLIELAEGLLRDLKEAAPEKFEAEIPYIQSFMDYLQDWTLTGGNNLGAFLRNWNEASPKISSPDGGDAIRVMTVHKAKGLEFPFVIVPFAESVTLYRAQLHWRRPKTEGTRLEGYADGVFRVSLDGKSADSLFSDDYYEEVRNQAADAINVFYVALTRAVYGLKIISAPPSDTFLKALSKGEAPKWNNLSQILYAYIRADYFKTGEFFDFSSLERSSASSEPIMPGYPSFAYGGGRLRFSPEAADFFGEDGLFGPEASTRIRGNVLHGILSRVRVPGDLPSAVEYAVSCGELPRHLQAQTLDFLAERIASVKERGWFCADASFKLEAPILAPDGREYRPDRVVIGPDGSVHVIDYKFGKEEPSYRAQVGRYVNLYRKMGYEKVSGYLWYLEENLIIFVD